MIGQYIPVFKTGNLLTAQMLEALTTYAVSYSELQYKGYSDGIIRGCDIVTSQKEISVQPGIVLYQGNVYFITEPTEVVYNSTSQWGILRLQFGEEVCAKGLMQRGFRIVLNAGEEVLENEIEIGRFKLHQGAQLRVQYTDFRDCSTEHDTFNEIYATWAAFGKSSISLRVLQEFAKEASKYNLSNPMDYFFCQQIISSKGETLNKDVIVTYLSKRLNKQLDGEDNLTLYNELKNTLTMIREGKMDQSRPKERRHHIIID